MLKKLFLFLFSFSLFISASAQQASIKGSVVDTVEHRKLQHSVIMLIRSGDSILVKSVRANAEGQFELTNLKKGTYSLRISYPRMADYVRDLKLTDSSKFNIGPIHMESKANLLNEVIIRAQKQAIQMKGDTIVYQADSFKVKPNANVQDLLKRLPGIVVDKNGTIKVGGDEVKTVLVEGEEFFGDDPLLATKYLKANAVSEVQVYDRKSKQTELTGIEDGTKDKVINIKLKDDAKNGYLSTLDANGDSDHYKNLGGMAGVYKGKLKAAVFGNTNNINEDSKITESMEKLKGGEYDVISVSDDGSSVAYSSSRDYSESFNEVNGLPNFSRFGAHFSDKWNTNKLGLKLNYLNTNLDIVDNRTQKSQSLLPNGNSFFGSGNSKETSKKALQTFKGNTDIFLDSLSTLKVTFAGKSTKNNNSSFNYDQSLNDFGIFVSRNNEVNSKEGNSDLVNGNINYTRKSKKKGRTLSIDLQPEAQTSTGTEISQNITNYYDANGVINRTDNLNVFKDNSGHQNSLGAKVSYSEPLNKSFSLQTAYSFKTVGSTSNRLVFDKMQNGRKIDSLSNSFQFNNFSNIGKAVLQYRAKKFSVNGGLEATQTSFELNDRDRNTTFNRNYLNWAPQSNISYKAGKNTTLRASYSGRTRQPSLEQLQPIRQINNPLYQLIGNQNLKPSFNNTLSLNASSYEMKSSQFISVYIGHNFTKNDIVSTSNVDQFNRTVSSYVNMNGNSNSYGGVNYQRHFRKLNMSTSMNINYNLSKSTSLFNGEINKNNYGSVYLNPQITYSTEEVDLSYGPTFNFETNKSSLGSINNGKTYSHEHEIEGTLQLPYKMEFNTSINLSYRPANASFATPLNIALWNAYLSAKALKGDALEIKLSVSDILNRKIGYDRYVGGNSVSENTYSYIPRFVLLGMTYNLTGNFAKAAK